MNYKFKTFFIASILALATTHSFAQTGPAVGTTLGDLQSAAATQTAMDSAIRLGAGELTLNYTAAIEGNLSALTTSAAVILQALDFNFALIDQDGTSVAPATAGINYAVIDQTTANNNAYIYQTGDQNYASVVQSGSAATVAYISQLGNSNRAIINQK